MPAGVMRDDTHRISAAALRSRGLIKTSGRGAHWTAKLTPSGRAYLARVDADAAASDGPRPGRLRYHHAVRAFRDRRERHEVGRVSLARALEFTQALVTEAQQRGWKVEPAPDSENGYGMLDWTGPKDGHLEVEANGRRLRLRIHEEGVHARGLWEEQVARFADVAADSPLRQEGPLPSGQYDAGGTGRLKLELCWGDWWTRQQTRWADTSIARLEERLPQVLEEIERRSGAPGTAVTPRAVAKVAEMAPPVSVPEPIPVDGAAYLDDDAAADYSAEDPREEPFGAALEAESARWEQAQRVRRYLDAMELAYGEHPETAEWIAWGRAYADRLDPLHELASPPRPPGLLAD